MRERLTSVGGVFCVVALAVLAGAGAGAGSEPRCFGAASRDPLRPCHNAALRLSVTPAPADALLQPNSACTLAEHTDVLSVCTFGTPAGQASGGVALVGDSHAAHWRAAVRVAALARGWLGASITRSGCPLSDRAPALGEPLRAPCLRWRAEVRGWLGRHAEVHTIFVSGKSPSPVAQDQARFAARVRGYASAWAALPVSVRRIVVLRDTPLDAPSTPACVQRAVRAGRAPGPACALQRRRALPPDPATAAAATVRDRAVTVVDLSSTFCDARRCFPVIGGVLVHKDPEHLTELFAHTLGPLLLRRLPR